MRKFVYLLIGFWFLHSNVLSAENSCRCTSNYCPNNATSECQLEDDGHSCFRILVKVGKESEVNEAGCLKSAIHSNFSKSLTIAISQMDGVYVAAYQCQGKDHCNEIGKLGLGLNSTCKFPAEFEAVKLINIKWNENEIIGNPTKDWCTRCNRSLITPPTKNESICGWAQRLHPWDTIIPPTPVPTSAKSSETKVSMYSSIGTLAPVLLISIVFGITERIKAKKLKLAKSMMPKRKGPVPLPKTVLKPTEPSPAPIHATQKKSVSENVGKESKDAGKAASNEASKKETKTLVIPDAKTANLPSTEGKTPSTDTISSDEKKSLAKSIMSKKPR